VEQLYSDFVGGATLIGNDLDNVLSATLGGNYMDGGAGNDEVDYWMGSANISIVRNADGSVSVTDTAANVSDTLVNVEHIWFSDDNLMVDVASLPFTGSAGADVFRLSSTDVADGATPRLEQFVSGEDVIDLSQIDANSAAPGVQAFTFVGSNAFDGVPGELRFDNSGSDTVLQADANGDGLADLYIVIAGHVTPTPADFVL
jgi:hypothetical protein